MALNFDEQSERERAERVAFQARCLELARHNGFEAEAQPHDWLPGLWWQVPEPMLAIVGCQMARVA